MGCGLVRNPPPLDAGVEACDLVDHADQLLVKLGLPSLSTPETTWVRPEGFDKWRGSLRTASEFGPIAATEPVRVDFYGVGVNGDGTQDVDSGLYLATPATIEVEDGVQELRQRWSGLAADWTIDGAYETSVGWAPERLQSEELGFSAFVMLGDEGGALLVLEFGESHEAPYGGDEDGPPAWKEMSVPIADLVCD